MSCRKLLLIMILALGSWSGPPPPGFAQAADTLSFNPVEADSLAEEGKAEPYRLQAEWMSPPAYGDGLITDPTVWQSKGTMRQDLVMDYNRVDRFRVGLRWQFQRPENRMNPRLGFRAEGATGRGRFLYGAQLEQPLIPPGRIALGVSMVRCTDHSELQQVEDVENSLALLFGRQDYRDYFEREGVGAYLSWRVPDFSTVSVHVRNDDYRSLPLDRGTRSFFQRKRDLRPNPEVDEGEAHGLVVRLERLPHRTHRTRAGLYHWVDLVRMGGTWGGDFEYTRLLADMRSVFRLSPATTLSLRAVGGYTGSGSLPAQKQFTVGGVDGLRAHTFGAFRGDQMLLGQAEYTVGLWPLRTGMFDGGLHAIVFVDAGRAWSSPSHGWDLDRQRFETDGGFGLSSSENDVRVYFARNLQEPDSPFVISMRLQRPF